MLASATLCGFAGTALAFEPAGTPSAGDNNTSPDNASAAESNATPGSAPDDAGDLNQITDVVVTAQRREEHIQKVPTTLTALSGSEVQSLNLGNSAADITFLVAAASAGETAPTRPRWWIRGVGTGAQGFDVQSPVGVYFDDVYFSNVNATGQPVYDLERVEVLEGPQGTLWGKNTTGGAINFISAKPSFNPGGFLKIDHSSYNDQLYEGAYGGALIDDVLAARGSFHAESAPGPYFNTFTGSSETDFHDNAGRLQFLANLTSQWNALLNVHYRDYYGNGNPWTVIGTGPNGQYYKPTANTPNGYTPNPDPSVISQNAPNTAQIRQDGAVLTITGPVGPNTLTSITGYEGFRTTVFSDADDTPLEIQRGWNAGHTKQYSEEVRLASPRTDRWNWLTGLMFFYEDITSETVTATLPNAATGSTPTGVASRYLDSRFFQNTKSYSGFVSSTFNMTDRLNLTAGVRYTNEIKSDNLNLLNAPAVAANPLSQYNNVAAWWLRSSVNGLQPFGTQNLRKDWGAWTYDATPAYEVTDQLRVYAKYARGFRAGTFNSSATSAANIGVVDPEYLTSYEIGLKSEWLSGRVIANAAAFRYNYDDIQINVVTAGLSQLTNAGAGKASGVEFTVEALPIENLHVRWNQAWLNTRFTQYTTGGISYAGNAFVRSPHLSVVLDADYKWALPKGELLLATDWRYTGRQYFYSNDEVDPNVTQEGYTVGNLRLSYNISRVSFMAYVDNVTDKIYKLHALLQTNSTAPAPSNIYLGGDTVAFSQGRIFGGSFTVRF